MIPHPNLATLLNLYQGDRQLFFARISPDYVCHTPGASQIAGRFLGPEGMAAHGKQMRDLTNQTFKVSLVGDILINDVHAMAPVELTAERAGQSLKMLAFGVWRFDGELVVEHWECPTELSKFDAFWS